MVGRKEDLVSCETISEKHGEASGLAKSEALARPRDEKDDKRQVQT